MFYGTPAPENRRRKGKNDPLALLLEAFLYPKLKNLQIESIFQYPVQISSPIRVS